MGPGGAQDKPQTADEIAAAFMAANAHVLREFDDEDGGVCSDHEYRAEGMPYGMSEIGGGLAGRPLESMHNRRCHDCPHSKCVDCEWGDA